MKPLYLASVLVGAVVGLSCESQPPTSPPGALSLRMTATGPASPCVDDRDRDKRSDPVDILCAVTVPDNPLAGIAKSWFVHERNALYIADQANKGVDVIDLRRYEYRGRVTGFVGAATAGGGTATTNGQGPNSMAPVNGHRMWVSDGNSQVQLVDLLSLSIVHTTSTAIAACDGGTETTHFCGRTNEMTYDPVNRVIIVTNPNPLDVTTHAPLAPYVSFIDARRPYAVLGTISFPDARGTPEAPVFDRSTRRLLLPVPTCNNAATCDPARGATEYIAVINGRTRSVEKKFVMPDCATLMPAITPPPTGMMNDMSIDQKNHHVIMPVCGRGEVVFDSRTGAVVNVITEITGSDQTWFNDGDGRFYVAANDPANANTRSLGVIDGRTGLWLQNVPAVGAVIPSASDFPANRVFTGVPASTATTACTPFGVAALGCVIVYQHDDGIPEKDHGHGHGHGHDNDGGHDNHGGHDNYDGQDHYDGQ